MRSLRPCFQLVGAVLFMTVPVAAAEGLDPAELVLHLADGGTRSQGTSGHHAAQLLLLKSMELAGLEDVHRMKPVGARGWSHLTGSLPAESTTEVVLTAHYDTVPGSRGELDNAAGCAATLGAVAEFSKVPQRNTTRVVLTDGEEVQAAGSGAWLSDLPLELRQRMLANLNVDMVGRRLDPGPGVVHILAGWNGGRRVVSPAWLVHAVLRGAETSGVSVSVLDSRWSWLAQLAVRCALPVRLSDGRRFLESGVPSVTVSDFSMTDPTAHRLGLDGELGTVDGNRLRTWIQTLAATLRRLDALEDRPDWETEYLVLAGRVWIRRDLVWVGFILWSLLVWKGLPGPWRRRGSADRRRLGRSYMPGFAFRILFLVTVFLIPTFATLLLYPLAVLALLPEPRRPAGRQMLCVLGALPALVFAAWLTVGQWAGWFILDRGALLPGTLILLTLAAFSTWKLDPSSARP